MAARQLPHVRNADSEPRLAAGKCACRFREPPFNRAGLTKDVRKGDKRYILNRGGARPAIKSVVRPSPRFTRRKSMWAGAPNKPI